MLNRPFFASFMAPLGCSNRGAIHLALRGVVGRPAPVGAHPVGPTQQVAADVAADLVPGHALLVLVIKGTCFAMLAVGG